MKVKQDIKQNESLLQEIKQLFESKPSKHKQDRDFLKQFLILLKKDQKLDYIAEVLHQLKNAAQQKSLYFNTIVDCLLIIHLKDQPVEQITFEILNSQCQTDKKAKDTLDLDELKAFCFQKLEGPQMDYQMVKKHLVLQERIVKAIQGLSTRIADDRKRLLNFKPIKDDHALMNVLLCLIIHKLVLSFNRDAQEIKWELKMLKKILKDQLIQKAQKHLVVIISTSNQHEQYYQILKACIILAFYIGVKVDQIYNIQILKSCLTIFKEVGIHLIEKDQTQLLQQNRIILDYLPSNFLFSVLRHNPQQWLYLQTFIQKNQQVSDQYLNTSISLLFQKQGKISNIFEYLKKDKKFNAEIWLKRNEELVAKTQVEESGNYNAYIYCQLHFLVFLNSLGLSKLYFQHSNIKVESKFFKQLALLRLEKNIFKYQVQISDIQIASLGVYHSQYLQKIIKQLINSPDSQNIKQVYNQTKLIFKSQYKVPFIIKMPTYIKLLFRDFFRQSQNLQLYPYDQEIYLISIISLSFFSKQSLAQLFISMIECISQISTQKILIDNIADIQKSALQQAKVQIEKEQIANENIYDMMYNVLASLITQKVIPNQNKKLTKFLQKLLNLIAQNSQRKEETYQQYSNLILGSLDRFLMLNGMTQNSFISVQTKFQRFFRKSLRNNLQFLRMLNLIFAQNQSQRSLYVIMLAQIYLNDIEQLETIHKDSQLKFCFNILCPQQAQSLIQVLNLLNKKQWELIILIQKSFIDTANYTYQKQILRFIIKESAITKPYFNILIKLFS
ncbi:hypothetical protein pb186bvf_004608 [Paramecium bursaria]